MRPHLLTYFDIQNDQNEPKFRSAYSINNLPKVKNSEYVISLDEYKSIKTHWIALHVNGDKVTLFNSFRVGHIYKNPKKLKRSRYIITNIHRIQA